MSRTMRDILYYATPIMTVIAMFFIVYGSYIAGGIFGKMQKRGGPGANVIKIR